MLRLTKRPVAAVLLAGLCGLVSHAQDQQVLSVEAFINQVKQYHPLAAQANLLPQKASADLLSARGSFDPVLETNNNHKSLDGVSYYQYTNPEIKIPTALGVTLKTGYEKSNGALINPERTRGVASYLGIELPVLNGLLTDKKRTALQQAKIYLQQSEQERVLMINDLLFNAYTSYWEWAGAYSLYQVYSRSVTVADRRAKLVSLSFRNGERPMADTMEAFAQLQNFRLLQSGALVELNKKILELSFYLWNENQEPYLLPEIFVPDTILFSQPQPLPDTSELIARASTSHPSLQITGYKGRILDAERKLKLQSLLPTVNVQANLLSKDYYQYKNISMTYLENNYKLGIKVNIPLLFRQGRGDYKNIRIKIRENNYELEKKTWEIQNKIRQYFTEATQLLDQLNTADEMNRAYAFLLKTEELKFAQGESSLFLVNSRENKTLEIQQKIIELQAKYLKAAYAIQWAGGIIQ